MALLALVVAFTNSWTHLDQDMSKSSGMASFGIHKLASANINLSMRLYSVYVDVASQFHYVQYVVLRHLWLANMVPAPGR